ncbi:hypothetical protein EJB05_34745 [Eragrostis curvula]|uniref:At1g61320/AtMIF1 LRR domain-containing protein n=1 Tax=Eragrostis curvula TaxID=38414 RepID=A0A5J9U592_9POAL|nr:hypothetical protein EJB05_34745 [Eragrostis curvula]
MPSSPSRRPGKRPAPPGAEVGGDSDGLDRISSLPDDLLHLVLVRLGCAREAARTSVLAHRWRGLWIRLPEFTFRGMELEAVETALAQVTRPALGRLDIKADLKSEPALGRVSSLLRAAAQLSPEALSVSLDNLLDGDAAVELPCFDRTSSLVLKMDGVPIALPPAGGDFSRLERLELTTGSNIFAALLPSCPRLRVLRINACTELKEITVHSATLEELAVESVYELENIPRIDIDAPEVKKMKLLVDMDREFSMTISAPKAVELDWKLGSTNGSIGFATHRLYSLNYRLSQGIRTLHLDIDDEYEDPVPDKTFAQEIARLRVTNFSVLEVVLESNEHDFGPLLVHLLQIQPAIQRLQVVVDHSELEDRELCHRNCLCRQPVSWKSENISLTNLEEVLISYYRFKGGNEEVDFLKLLFRCAPGLKRMGVGARRKYTH